MLTRIILSLSLVVTSVTAFGGDHGPGGTPDLIVKRYLQDMVENPQFNLKASMKNYLNTIKDNKVAANSPGQILVKNKKRLLQDIDQSSFIVRSGSSEGYCLSSKRLVPAASTDFGKSGSPIYFDLEPLFASLKDRSPEVQMVEIGALAFHELVHHLQKAPARDKSSCDQELMNDENQANEVAAYVIGNVFQAPFMQWVESASVTDPAISQHFDYCLAATKNGETKNGTVGNYFEAICTNGKVTGQPHYEFWYRNQNAESDRQEDQFIGKLKNQGFNVATSFAHYKVLSTAPRKTESFCITATKPNPKQNTFGIVCSVGAPLIIDASLNVNTVNIADAARTLSQNGYSNVGELDNGIALYRKYNPSLATNTTVVDTEENFVITDHHIESLNCSDAIGWSTDSSGSKRFYYCTDKRRPKTCSLIGNRSYTPQEINAAVSSLDPNNLKKSDRNANIAVGTSAAFVVASLFTGPAALPLGIVGAAALKFSGDFKTTTASSVRGASILQDKSGKVFSCLSDTAQDIRKVLLNTP